MVQNEDEGIGGKGVDREEKKSGRMKKRYAFI